jgi:hypothetical protein
VIFASLFGLSIIVFPGPKANSAYLDMKTRQAWGLTGLLSGVTLVETSSDVDENAKFRTAR